MQKGEPSLVRSLLHQTPSFSQWRGQQGWSVPIIEERQPFVKNQDGFFWAMIKVSGYTSRFDKRDTDDNSHSHGAAPSFNTAAETLNPAQREAVLSTPGSPWPSVPGLRAAEIPTLLFGIRKIHGHENDFFTEGEQLADLAFFLFIDEDIDVLFAPARNNNLEIFPPVNNLGCPWWDWANEYFLMM